MNQELKDRIKNLSPEQLKVLMEKMGKKKTVFPKMERNIENSYSLSSAQKRMWFLSKLDPTSYLYTNPISIRIKTEFPLDLDCWEQSFNLVVKRHDIMRTSFSTIGGEVKQTIHNDVNSKIINIDLRSVETKNKNTTLHEILKKDAQSIIDIEAFPLFRHTVIQLDETELVFVYTSHHIISDAWSSSALFREILAVYMIFQKNETPSVNEHEYQFIDYVNWEENWVKSDAYKKAVEVWKKLIPANPEPLNLPYDFKRPEKINSQGDLIKTTLNKEFTAKLSEFSKQNNINLFHTLLGAFNILLNKYSNNREIVVGIPLANREIKELQSTVGMFLNTLPLRSEINTTDVISDYLNKVKDTAQQVFFNQQFPFERLVETLKPPRDTSISPIFQVLFVYQNIPSLYAIDRIHLEPIKPNIEASKFELNLWIEEVNDELQLSLTYQTSLFKRETIKQLLNRYEFLLNEFITNINSKINTLQIEKEVPKINDFDFPKVTKTYLDYFYEHVEANPETPALQDNFNGMSYADLDCVSNQLASVFQKKIKTTSKIIAVLLDKNNSLFSSILGIHKMGCAYLPINEDAIQQLQFILKDADVDGIVSEKKYTKYFKNTTIPIVYIDKVKDGINSESSAKLSQKVNINDLAYVIYTSGSTGKPKGVQVAHKQLANYSTAVWKRINLPKGTRCATVTSISTDLGNTQIFPVLAGGGTIDIIDKETATNPILFGEYMSKNKVDTIKIVPSHLASLLAGTENANILPRKALVLGGEKPSYNLLRKVRELSPNLRIINHYGPTETTIGILTHEIIDIAENLNIPIGKPLEGNKVLICNLDGSETPSGIIGEITVIGNNVSRGYIGNEDLNEKRNFFLIEGQPAYKTGDLGKINTEGDIEIIGRKDRQVKVRGFRIELDALQNIAKTIDGIKEAVVLLKNDSLCFYVYCLENTSIAIISESLKTKLPAYLWPFTVTILNEFPILGNGKIDYKKLSKIDSVNLEMAKNEIQAPRDEVELDLLAIWKKVLKIEYLGINDNFFDVGGHSLMAIELIARINKTYSTNFQIGILFEHNSINSIAKQIRLSNSTKPLTSSSIVLLNKGTSKSNLFIVHPAGGDVFAYYELASRISKDVNVYGLQSEAGKKDVDSIEEMASNYLQDIAAIDGNHFFAGWSMGALVAFEMAFQYKKKTNKERPVIILDQIAPAINIELETYEDEVDRLVLFASKIEHLVNNKLNISKEILNGKNATERSEIFLKEFKKNNMVPADLQVDQFHGFLEKMIHHNEITTLYKGNNYTGPVTLVKAKESTFISNEFEDSIDYGWSNYTQKDINIEEVKGNHITMMRHPNIDLTAKIISTQILKIKKQIKDTINL